VAFAQDSAVEIFQRTQGDEYFDTKDDQQDWLSYFICKDLDRLHDIIAANELARQEDNRELRGQMWKLAFLVAGGGAAGGIGGAKAVKAVKKRNGGGK